MTIVPRVIPVLLLSQQRFVKTRKFKSPIYIGDPITLYVYLTKKKLMR